IEIVVPELAFAAEAAQLDHRQHEVEAVAFGVQRDLPVEGEARLVLRRGRRDQPAVAADGDEDTDFHALRSPVKVGSAGQMQNPDPSTSPMTLKRSGRSRLDQNARRGRGYDAIGGVIPTASPAGTVFAKLFARNVSINRSDGGVRWHGNLLKPRIS